MTDPAPYLTAADLTGSGGVLDNTTDFPEATLTALVAEFEELAERYRGRAYRPRSVVVTVPGTTSNTLLLDYIDVSAVTAATIDGDAIDEEAVTVWPDGRLVRSAGWGTCESQVVVTITHGADEPPPAVLRACREFVRAKATAARGNLPRDVPRQLTGNDAGYIAPIPPANWTGGAPTGIKVVDDALNSVPDARIPGVG